MRKCSIRSWEKTGGLALIAIAFCLAAALGGAIRFLFGTALNGRWPMGTLTVNLAGAFLVGALHELSGGSEVVVVVAGLGSLTSVSAVADEAATLAENSYTEAAAYVAATSLGAVMCCLAGLNLS